MKNLTGALLAIVFTCFWVISPAAEFTVNDTSDMPDDNPGDGMCEATAKGFDCTLRAAIMETNALAGADIINIPAGTYLLTIDGTDDEAALGDLDIEYDEISIHGAGADTTILDANGLDRFFNVQGSTFTLEDVTIQNGHTDKDSNLGGAISIFGIGKNLSDVTIRRSKFINNSSHLGGAIRANQLSTILIEDSLFSGNETIAGASNRTGAAIYCQGCEITLDRCLLTNNGDDLSGKIVEVDANGQLNILNTTISGNPFGGGVRASNGNVLIKFSTLFENGGQNLSFFSFDDSHVFEVAGSVLQTSTSDNCQAGDLPVSLGYNIVSDMSCVFAEKGDMQDTNAMLAALADNGGPTLTHLPQSGSPVLDHAPLGACTDLQDVALAVDQRGETRPFGPQCDSGAVEVQEALTPFAFEDGFEIPSKGGPFCNANEHVISNMCLACPAGTTNAPGDDPSGGDTLCDATFCGVDQHVQSNTCVACPKGTTNAPGDDASGSDTECDVPLCNANEHVISNMCVACPAGTTNAPGDDPSGGDTLCDATFCGVDQHVQSHTCVACPKGTTNAPGDDASGGDTECDEP